MHDEIHVYELDAESIVRDLLTALVERGEDVVEQAPAGVWWFRTHKDQAAVAADIVEAFGILATRNLRRIEQDAQ